ncbi:hypothetical protein [Burkholderia pyrrocinia]|uniref:hypothetical protein n=1 Tax=Burkholderia pyrrocinia TaxID=60550 RepID=UPI00158F5789|nr:hypothetical protein [Burkholderia pyrrocinia]
MTPMKCWIKAVALTVAMLMSVAVHADEVVLPSRDAAWLKGGASADPAAVRQATPGKSLDDVYALLDRPHLRGLTV